MIEIETEEGRLVLASVDLDEIDTETLTGEEARAKPTPPSPRRSPRLAPPLLTRSVLRPASRRP